MAGDSHLTHNYLRHLQQSFTPRDQSLMALINALMRYSEVKVVDSQGKQFIVLGMESGEEAVNLTGVTGGPFTAYLADSTPGAERFAVGEGTIVTNVATGASIVPNGCGTLFYLYSDTKVWIECVIASDLTMTSAEVKTGAVWPTDNGIKFSGSVQTMAYVHIGSVKDYSLPSGAGGFNFDLVRNQLTRSYHFDQKIQTNLFIALMAYDGKAAVFPLPFSG